MCLTETTQTTTWHACRAGHKLEHAATDALRLHRFRQREAAVMVHCSSLSRK